MSIAILIRQMAAAGATPEAIALAVEAIEAVEAKLDESRSAARERKRRQRDKSRDSHGTVTPDVTNSHAETLSLPPSPQPPQPPTHTRVCISTHAREAAEFDRFWAVYPKRVAKDEARKAFSRALKRASADEIVSAVERQRDWEQWVRGFIPNASTWLNQGRWADEEPQIADTTPTRKANDRPDHHTTAGSAREEGLRNMYAGAMAAIDERRRDVG